MTTRPMYLHGFEVGPDGEAVGGPVWSVTVYDRGNHAEHGGPVDVAELEARRRGLKVVVTNDQGRAYVAFYPDGRMEHADV